jgi:2-phospho-L-lactate/phosphoenolpyruvate guanylyltransferase
VVDLGARRLVPRSLTRAANYSATVLTIVVPFRAGGKSRLPETVRVDVALAMLGDVVEAAVPVAATIVVTSDASAADLADAFGARAVEDPGGGQGAAVSAALGLTPGHVLVVNADLPCTTSDALRRLAAAGAALVPAADGTTNALSLPDPARFEPVYGAGSAGRFTAIGFAPISISELEVDLDTLADLSLLAHPLGRRTLRALEQHGLVFAGSVPQ